eukprot:TRINITY_DN55196_c0_g1_i1.p1 TRINITY_DN55196_c0_g1~~TRINITY_DN55196_c0_g1_i1.p1  ORF type:complete len:728 (+),score=124.68 TRINITY_DN55196_c0_g1_i1:217-2184(+)
MEEVIRRNREAVREGFDVWIRKFITEVQTSKIGKRIEFTSASVWQDIIDLIDQEGHRARIRELEASLNYLLPLAENIRGKGEADTGGSSDSAFWNRVMVRVREDFMRRRGSTSMKAQQEALEREAMAMSVVLKEQSINDFVRDPSQLGVEIAEIWDFVADKAEHFVVRYHGITPNANEVMRKCIKSFYLRHTDVMKHLEFLVSALCRGILDTYRTSSKNALFAIVADIKFDGIPVETMPQPVRDIDFDFSQERFSKLPSTTPLILALLTKNQRLRREYHARRPASLRRTSSRGNMAVLLQDALHVGRSVMPRVGRDASCTFFLVLFSFVEFPTSRQVTFSGLGVQLEAVSRASSATSANSTAPLPGEASTQLVATDVNSDDEGGGTGRSAVNKSDQDALVDDRLLREMLFASLLMHSYVEHKCESSRDALMITSEASETLVIWRQVLDEASSLGGIRKSLGLSTGSTACRAEKVAELLRNQGIVHLPLDFLTRAILTAGGHGRHVDPASVEVDQDAFMRFAWAFQTSEAQMSPRCDEDAIIWAGLWALISAREHEVDLLSEAFSLFDAAGDGRLPFQDFMNFARQVVPHLTPSEAEDVFWATAEEGSVMTRDGFMKQVLHMGISTNVDELENNIVTRRAKMYGELTSTMFLKPIT